MELVSELILSGYTGPKYDRFANALAAYGFQVIRSWIRTGLILQRCREKGLGLYLPRGATPELTEEDIEDITQETLVKALRAFKDEVLVPGVWDHTKGATLKTYFIGQCLIRFANVYRTAVGRLGRQRLAEFHLPTEGALDNLKGTTPDPEMTQIRRSEIRRAARQIKSPVTREILFLLSQGHTQAEVAEMLGLTIKAVESRLLRHRNDLRKEDIA